MYEKYNELMKGHLRSDVVPAILKAKGDAKIKVGFQEFVTGEPEFPFFRFQLLRCICILSLNRMTPHLKGIHSPLGES